MTYADSLAVIPRAQFITPSEHDKREWSRMAQAAYAADRNDVGHRMSGYASILRNQPIPIAAYDALQSEYREWLTVGTFHNLDSVKVQVLS